ncbi:hypothetical protein WAX74_10590 [Psychrobacillus sp. FJAT-51614]|uniref:Group-specific protein n=1 Tax=Psychrobacillus mangrovi TaxID=3117745 RepID=A0ABU8F505_9BACI
MFDPTIFENLKVAFENQVYDLDNIERKIHITNREDQIDLSILAREFSVQFSLVDPQDVTAEIVLKATLDELAGEILELPVKNIGCTLLLRFYKRVQNFPIQCNIIEQTIKEIWEDDSKLTQTLSFLYNQEEPGYLDTIEVEFTRKINEEHMGEIEEFLEHVLETLEELHSI